MVTHILLTNSYFLEILHSCYDCISHFNFIICNLFFCSPELCISEKISIILILNASDQYQTSIIGVPTPAASSYPYKLKRNHGVLAIFGWGVLLPVGVIIARYCKKWDPLWYYLHVIMQFAGFIIGLAGVVAGIALYNKLHSDVFTHRGLGIFFFVLGILQWVKYHFQINIKVVIFSLNC